MEIRRIESEYRVNPRAPTECSKFLPAFRWVEKPPDQQYIVSTDHAPLLLGI